MKSAFNAYIDYIENALRENLIIKDNPQKIIYEAMGYSLFAGGKRLRPMMALEFCKMCGGSKKDILPFALSVEMIHTYSLIHDDLPAMDNDDMRRGKPSNHKMFGEATAILAGDALLNFAFENILNKARNINVPAEITLRAMAEIATASGTEGMIGGQVMDLLGEGKSLSIAELEYLQNNKTGALFTCACAVGAIVGGGSEEQIAAAKRFAGKLGLAFQIKDDMLDVVGDSAVLGKPIGSDKVNEKSTFLSHLTLDEADEMVKKLTDGAIDELEAFDNNDFMKYLSKMLVSREK